MSDARFERDLRMVLDGYAAVEPPASIVATLRGLPTAAPSPWFERLATVAFAGAALVVLAVVGALLVLSFSRPAETMTPGSGGRQLTWRTDAVTFEANSLLIEAGGLTFSPPAGATVTSDPGTSTYRTLEFTWREQGVEMRLNLYFAADDSSWWLSEIRTYDGRSPGEWIGYRAPQVRAARGDSFSGDVDIVGAGRVSGRLVIKGLRLTAFAPGTGVRLQPGCRNVGPTPGPDLQPQPAAGDLDLGQFGVQTGMSAALADSRLTGQGICHEFRYVTDGYSQIWCQAPPGKVTEALSGSEGQLILFVESGPNDQPANAPPPPALVGC